ncbi:MAG: S-layer homology domain-containing protein, partial [Oscillospiraceae bacterium]|nr:S-layer homology domain-containing protein [Oscillospiraceae bacterium]
SYRFPDYSEATNDNLSNMNGTINNGIMVYDIIKGERTYQYLPSAKVPLYPFGYGLSYGQFEYSNVAVSAISDGKFTVSGKVKNTGSKTSDEVVQIYSAFADTESRIKQPIKKLIAYERLHDIAPGDEESFSFVIDLQDKLGVWDVESGGYVVEAGAYVITAGGSSADADDMDGVGGNDAMLTVAVGVGVNNGVDLTATKRDLKKLTLAENLDDYSEKGEQVDDIETVSASIAYKSNTAIQFRKDGAWISFKNVDFTSAPARLTVQAGSDRTGSLTVYALPTGGDPDTELTAATTIATIALTDTRPGSLATGLGIGPVGVYPGSVDGQTYKDAYVKPEWRKYGVNVTVTTGTYDIYIETEKRGAVLEWLQFNAPETATDIAIDQLYSLDSIREKSGALTLSANLTPVTALDAVAWSVANKSGTGAALAEINAATGVLTATGANNGTVTVTVTAGNQTATKDILITNQLDSNKVTVDSQNLTVDYLLLRTGAAFGANDNISRWQGTNQQTAVFLAPERVNIGGAYFLYATPGSGYTTLPANALDWAVYGSDGVSATTLATIDQAGLLTAAGTGNGDVVVKATLKNNLDIFVTRTIRLQNQSRKDGRKMIQAENWDTATAGSTGNPATTYMAGGNEVGLYQTAAVTAEVNQAVLGYKKVDFGTDAGSFQIRMATTASSTLELWIDGQNTADGGVKIGGPTIIPAGASYATYRTVVLPILPTSGEHDLYLVTTATASGTALTNRLNYFQLFSLGTGEVATYTVTFNPNGGTVTTPSQVVLIDTPATEPTAASRHGYTFSGWYTAATTGSKWNFANPVTSDLILYAHWAEVPSSGYTPTGPTTPSIPSTPVTPDAPSGPLGGFSDAGQVSSWATEFVERLVEAEIISGRPNGTIDPRGNVTRAEFTKMIVLGLKLEAGEAPKSFADVTAGDWFKSVVDIASSHEIVLGVSETAFAPNRTITRQDLCTIVYRGLVALDVTLPAIEDGGAFPDEAQIASYALDAVKTLRQLNIVTGRSSGVFDPRAYATREETAKIICGVIDYVASASASAPVDSTEPASTEPAA